MERYKRLSTIGLASLVSTALLLRIFQDPDPDPSTSGSGSGSGSTTITSDNKRQRRKSKSKNKLTGLARLGDHSVLEPDFVDGLLKLCKAASKERNGVGVIEDAKRKKSPVVLLTQAEHIRHAIYDDDACMEMCGLNKLCFAYFETSLENLLRDAHTPTLMKMLRSPGDKALLVQMGSIVRSSAYELANTLFDYAERGDTIDVFHFFSTYHLNCIGRTVFDSDVLMSTNQNKAETLKALNFMLHEIPKRALSDEDPFAPSPMVKHPAISLLKSMLLPKQKKEKEEERGEERFLDADIRSLTYALWDIKDAAVMMTIALFYVAKNPNWMAKAQAEADQVLLSYEGANKATAGVADFPICEAIFKESVRVLPPEIIASRRTERTLKLGKGVEIPAQMTVWSPILYLHHDKQEWGRDADVWNPQRWFRKHKGVDNFIPFSHGAQRRVGKQLESVVAMAVLLKKYNFELVEDFEFNPVFNESGLVALDAAQGRMGLNLKITNRIHNSEFLYDWSSRV